MKRKLLWLVVASIVMGMAGVVAIGAALSSPWPRKIGSPPKDIPIQTISVYSESGSQLSGWYIPGSKKRGGIVLAHGVRANRISLLTRARLFYDAGYSVVLFDLQAHGESSGEHITFGYLEARDIDAMVKFLREKVSNRPIGIIGMSLGGAVTVLSKSAKGVDALVLEAVYTDLTKAISNRLQIRFGEPGRFLVPLLTWQIKPRLGISAHALSPLDRVKEIDTPILVIGGSDDLRTTMTDTMRLYEAIRGPKKLWIVNGGKHQDYYLFEKERYQAKVIDFLETNMSVDPR